MGYGATYDLVHLGGSDGEKIWTSERAWLGWGLRHCWLYAAHKGTHAFWL